MCGPAPDRVYRSRHPSSVRSHRRKPGEAAYPAVFQPFLSRFSTQMDEKFGFWGPETPKWLPPTVHPSAPTSPPPIEAPCSGGSDVRTNGYVAGGGLLGVSSPQNPIFCPFGSVYTHVYDIPAGTCTAAYTKFILVSTSTSCFLATY